MPLDQGATARVQDHMLTLQSIDGSIELRIDVTRLDAIDSVAVSPSGERIAIVGIDRGQLSTDPFRSDTRTLYVVGDGGSGDWQRPTRVTADEPVWFANSDRLAVQAGVGPAVIELTSNRTIRARVSPVPYGPGSIALSPDEHRLAVLKYRSNHLTPSVWDLVGKKPTHLRTSAYSYGWWDDATLLCEPLAAEPRLVDVGSGRWKRFARIGDLLDAARPSANAHLDGLKPERWDVQYGAIGGYSSLVVDGDRLFFSLVARETFTGSTVVRGSGIYSFDRDLGSAQEHLWVNGWAIRSFVPFHGGRVCWIHAERGMNPIDHRVGWCGEGAASIPNGSEPVRPKGIPTVGFHGYLWDPRRPSRSQVIRSEI